MLVVMMTALADKCGTVSICPRGSKLGFVPNALLAAVVGPRLSPSDGTGERAIEGHAPAFDAETVATVVGPPPPILPRAIERHRHAALGSERLWPPTESIAKFGRPRAQ